MSLTIIGPHKIGVTTIAKALAEKLNLTYTDTELKPNTVLDLKPELIKSKQKINAIKENSTFIALLPMKNNKKSIQFLYQLEKDYADKDEVEKNYQAIKPKLDRHADIIIYVQNKTPEEIVKEIIKALH